MLNRIVIGTAQFGSNYGISNTKGKVNSIEIKKILEYAATLGIDTLDTAKSYGSSEEELSNFISDYWHVSTKIQRMPDNLKDVYTWMENQIDESMNRLGVKSFSSLFFHDPMQLLEKDGSLMWKSIQKLKEKKQVNKIGFSIYSPKELDKLLNLYKPDVIQVPYNILDRRIEESGWLKKLQNINIEVQARSIFLQGLLLMDIKDRPDKFFPWSDIWSKWEGWLKNNKLTATQAAFAFAFQNTRFNKIVIGIENVEQLKEIYMNLSLNISSFPDFDVHDINLIDPSKWNDI